MNNWETVKLKDVCKRVTVGFVGTMSHEYRESGVPFLRSQNITPFRVNLENLKFIDDKFHEKIKKSTLHPGDVGVVRTGYPGTACVIPKELKIANCSDLVIIRPGERLNPYFLCAIFNSTFGRDLVGGNLVGAAQQHFNVTVAKELNFLLPPRPVQDKIAAVLNAYDDLIESNKRRIALLEMMAEEIYREWFVRMRFLGHEKVKVVKGVPEGWEVKKFRDIVSDYIGGGWGEENLSGIFSEGAYVIRGTDIPELYAGDLQNEVFRFHKPSNLKSRLLETGDFVFEVSGGSKNQLLGRNLLLTDKLLGFFNNKVIAASFCKQIRFDKNLVSPYFMKYFLKLYYDYDLVGIYQVQSTGISNYQFESFLTNQSIIIPSSEIRVAFDKIIKPMLDTKDNLALANFKLLRTRDMLLPRLISGKLSVENLDIQFPPSMQDEATS